MKSINLLGVANGVGISRDLTILKEVLVGAGYEVETNHTFRFTPKKKYDLNIFLERFKPSLFSSAHQNVFIPNQEWFEPGWLPVLPAFTQILTKTRFADDVFKNLGCNTSYISFTSDDRYLENVQKDNFHFIHIAGKSIQKQTDIVLKTWEKNPGFPTLTIIQDPKFYKPHLVLRNVNYMYDHVPEVWLRTMQNCCSVHICSSQTEGFGHYIMEALSCKGLVLTTDGPPMNELVTNDRGIFIKSVKQEPMRFSTKFHISVESLEEAVIRTLILDDQKIKQMRDNAREFYLSNDAFFRQELIKAVANVFAAASEG